MKHLGEVIPIEAGIDRATARLNTQFQPKVAALDASWVDLQHALRHASSDTGVPIRTRRWEYQWPTFERTLDTIDDTGRAVTTPALVSVRGLLKHTPRSLAFGALDQLYRCQVAEVPVLPSSRRKLWEIIESRTIGYEAKVVLTRPGTSVIEDEVGPSVRPIRRIGVELMGVNAARDAYSASLAEQSRALADFLAYVNEGSGFGPNGGGEIISSEMRAV